MTDNEIIKAMQCVIGNDVSCSECEYQKVLPFPSCRRMCAKNALDLINRQKAENEELRSDKIIAETHERNARNLFTDCVKQLEEARAEIKELKDILEKVPTNAYDLQVEASEKLENQIKSEAIKDFAERLKRTSIGLEIGDDKKFKMTVVSTVAIDNLVEEMTEVSE